MRSLTAAAALAATLGIAGLAQAQTNPAPVHPSAPAVAPATHAAGDTQTAERTPASISPATIQNAQQKLKSQGLYHGAIDGRMGPATRTALSHYQRKEGLPRTAMLDRQTLKRLLPGSGSGMSR
ncbi:MAG TPA: peptidoglycan-binding domain-containing protein [Stellaceae bacterium]|nr:peptidoglycan-binding domain-containing protein [Stellaceae bacterium]